MVLTGWGKLRGFKRQVKGSWSWSRKAREGASAPPTPHPSHTHTHSPTPGHLAVCRAVGRQIRIWEREITSLLPPGRGCWSQGRSRAGQAGWGGVCVCSNLGRKMQPVHNRGNKPHKPEWLEYQQYHKHSSSNSSITASTHAHDLQQMRMCSEACRYETSENVWAAAQRQYVVSFRINNGSVFFFLIFILYHCLHLCPPTSELMEYWLTMCTSCYLHSYWEEDKLDPITSKHKMAYEIYMYFTPLWSAVTEFCARTGRLY